MGSVQFSSVTQLCPTLCDPMNSSMPGLPVHHQLPEFTQTQCPSSQWCHPAISSSVVPFSSCPQSLTASGSFPMSQLFAWGGQSTGVSALAYKGPNFGNESKNKKGGWWGLNNNFNFYLVSNMCHIFHVLSLTVHNNSYEVSLSQFYTWVNKCCGLLILTKV